MTNTASTPSANDLLNGGGGPPAFKFDKVGDTVKGVITKTDTSQVVDFVTKEPKFYSDNRPIMQIVITVQQDNGEECRVFVKPAMKVAIREAVQAAGAEGFEINAQIAVKYSGDEPSQKAGLNPKKLFTAQYKPPVNNISADDLL